MRPKAAVLLAALLVGAAVPAIIAQIDGPETLPNERDDGPLEIVQVTEDHYIVVIDVPATAFDEGRTTDFDVPLGPIALTGGEGEAAYRIRLVLDPGELTGNGATLNDTIWQVHAELVGKLDSFPLPSVPEFEALEAVPTLDDILAQLRQLEAQLNATEAAIDEALVTIPEQADGVVEGTGFDNALVDQALHEDEFQLELAGAFLNDTIGWLALAEQGLLGDLAPAERSLRITGALLADLTESLNETLAPFDEAVPDLPDRPDPALKQAIEDARDEAWDAYTLASGARDDLIDHARATLAYSREARDWVFNEVDPSENTIATARAVLRDAHDNYTGLRTVLGNATDPGDGPGDENETGEPDRPHFPGTPGGHNYSSVRAGLLALYGYAKTGETERFDAEMRDAINASIFWLEGTDARINWTITWLESNTVAPFVAGQSERAAAYLSAADEELAELEEILATFVPSDEDDGSDEERSGEALAILDTVDALFIAADEALAQAAEDLRSLPDEPFRSAEQALSRPTQVRVYLPRDVAGLGAPGQLPLPGVPGLETPEDGSGGLGTDLPDLPGTGTGDGADTNEGEASNDQDGPSSNADRDPAPERADVAEMGLTASPGSVHVHRGQQKVVTVTVHNKGDDTETYHLTTEHDGPFALDAQGPSMATLAPDGLGKFRVRVTPHDTGEGEARFIVTADGGSVAGVSTPVTITPTPRANGPSDGSSDGQDGSSQTTAADLRVDVEPYAVKLRQSEEGLVSVVVKNRAAASDTITVVPQADGPFRASLVGPASVELAPGAKHAIGVRITPDQVGKGSIALHLTSANGGELQPMLLVDVLDPAAAAGDESTQASDASSTDGDAPPAEDDERRRGLPVPAWTALVALVTGGLLVGRRRP